MKAKESTLGELIDWLNQLGWDKGIKMLEKNLHRVEWLQADLYGNGDYKSIKEAQKLTPTIIKMNMTLATLNKMKREGVPDTPNSAG